MTAPAFPLPDGLLDQVVLATLAEDLGSAGDITTGLTVDADTIVTGLIRNRKAGVVAGLDVAARAFALIDNSLSIDFHVHDGDGAAADTELLEVSGNARSILTAERTALNFLGHLSGISTETRKLVDAVAHTATRICCTRKTTPGLRALEKYAVRCGGGFNHRFGLYDGLLIKDNHIVAADGIADAVRQAKSHAGHMVKIEVEVDRIDQIEPALGAGADVIMLDNMDPATMTEAGKLVAGRAVVEASGSITLATIAGVAESGVDVI